MQILLLVHPVAERDDDVAFHALRAWRLALRDLALLDPFRPIAEIFERGAAEITRADLDHRHSALTRLDAAEPHVGIRDLLFVEQLRNGARRELAQLMTADAPIALDAVEIA